MSPKFLEDELKREYGANSKIPYKIMNAKGYMHGSAETAKGAEAQAKHDADQKSKASKRHRRARKLAQAMSQ